MLTYITRRVVYTIPVVLIASFLLFSFVRTTFDPTAHLRASRTAAEAIKSERVRLGLNKPIVVQYWDWLKKFVRGDWGTSERTHERVFAMIRRSLWATIQLIFWGVLISALIAIAMGVYSAVRQYSALDYTFTGLSFIALAMPPFWFGLIAIQFLSADLKDVFHLRDPLVYSIGLHKGGLSGFNVDYIRHLILPVMTLTVQIVAGWSRYQRAAMLDVMSADYIRTARAKGVSRFRVVIKHGLRNALIPLITVMAIDIGALFGGLVVTEQIFSIHGMGFLFLNALQNGDTQTLLPWLMVSAVFIILFNLLADVLYGALDPRVRLS
jgi:peptide/nickel transport system permease protein